MASKKRRGRKSKEFLRRSAAAKKGWVTRRRNQRERESGIPPEAAPSVQAPDAPKMWRITVSANYYIRKAKRRNAKGESPDSAAFMVRGWYASYAEALNAYDELDDLANEGRDEAIDDIKNAFTRDEDTNVSIQEVEFDERLLSTISQVNEK